MHFDTGDYKLHHRLSNRSRRLKDGAVPHKNLYWKSVNSSDLQNNDQLDTNALNAESFSEADVSSLGEEPIIIDSMSCEVPFLDTENQIYESDIQVGKNDEPESGTESILVSDRSSNSSVNMLTADNISSQTEDPANQSTRQKINVMDRDYTYLMSSSASELNTLNSSSFC